MSEVHHDNVGELTPEKALEDILDTLSTGLKTPCTTDNGRLFVPEWQMTIKPEVVQLEKGAAVLNFHVFCPEWDEPLFETCAAYSKDDRTAVGMALGSFVFGFMQGLLAMINDDHPEKLNSRFMGAAHRWSVYKSDSVGMGESVGDPQLWELLKKQIEERLGNQKLCYVKVFASKAVGSNDTQVLGEVRVNDIPSPDLGDIVKHIAENWNVERFASLKQFFFIKQAEETTLPQSCSGIGGRMELMEKTKLALQMYLDCSTRDDLDALYDKLAEMTGDITLAEELLAFMPEMAAENAFSQMRYSDKIMIASGNKKTELYKDQLADYYPIQKTLFSLLSSGEFGERTDDLFRMLVGNSSIYSVVREAGEKGSRLEDCRLTALMFNVSEDFIIR